MWTKEQKKCFINVSQNFTFTFFPVLRTPFHQRRYKTLYSAVHTPASFFPAFLPVFLTSLFVILLLFISSCQKICFLGYTLFEWYLFATFIHLFQSYLQKSIIFNMLLKKWIYLKQMTKPIFSVTLADHLIGEKEVLVCRVIRLCWSLFLCFRYILYVFEILQMELAKQSKE